MRRPVLFALLIFLTAFGCRLAYVLKLQTYRDGHPAEMERAAATLAQEGFLGNVYGNNSGPSAHVSPLYSGGLAGVYFLFGAGTATGRFVQELLAFTVTSACLALMPLVARKARLHPAAGWAAGFLLALSPVNLWIETSGSWEQPYAALVLLGLFLTFVSLHDQRWESRRPVVLAGLLLGGAGLLSPSLLPAGGLMRAAELLSQRGRRFHVVRGGLLQLLILGACLLPWTVRNYRALGGFVPLRSNFGLELAIGNHPQSTGRTFDTSYEDPNSSIGQLHPFNNKTEGDLLLRMGELAYMREQSRRARGWIADHPGEFAGLTLERFRLYWFPPMTMWSPSTSARLFKSVVFCVTGAGAWCGLCWLIVARHPYRGLLAAVLFGASLIYLVTHVDTRYRYPLFGFSMLLTCECLCRLWQLLHGCSTRGKLTPTRSVSEGDVSLSEGTFPR